MIKVFYDGKCGLCSKEIHYYKKISPKDIFEWIDITQTPQVLEAYDIPYQEALKKLHSVDLNGKMHIGIDSFILIWKKMRYFKILACLVSLPVIYPLMGYIYNKFAEWRFHRLEYCNLTKEETM